MCISGGSFVHFSVLKERLETSRRAGLKTEIESNEPKSGEGIVGPFRVIPILGKYLG